MNLPVLLDDDDCVSELPNCIRTRAVVHAYARARSAAHATDVIIFKSFGCIAL